MILRKILPTFCLFLLFFLCFNQVTAAQDCEVKTDPFTNRNYTEYRSTSGIRYTLTDSGAVLQITYSYSGQSNVKFGKGTKVLVKLENNQVVELITSVESAPIIFANTNFTTSHRFVFVMTNELLERLMSANAAIIRFPGLRDGFEDLELTGLTKSMGRQIREGAECVRTGKIIEVK